MPLELTSSRWQELRHAHGSAENIPAVLQQLMASSPIPQKWQDPLWFPLWDSLLHQGIVSAPAYAVVPHLVGLASLRTPQERLSLFHFVGATACSVGDKAPDELVSDYRQACRECRNLILQTLASEKWGYADVVNLLADLAAVNEQRVYGRTLWLLTDGELEACCPFCEARAFFGVTEDGIDPPPIEHPDFSTPTSSETTNLNLLYEYDWSEATTPVFLTSLSKSLGQDALAKQISHLSGDAVCLSCHSKYPLIRAVDWYWLSLDI